MQEQITVENGVLIGYKANGGDAQYKQPETEMQRVAEAINGQTADPFTPEELEAIRLIEGIEVFSDICILKQVSEAKSIGGLILPGEEKKKRVGKVLACGPGRVYESGTFVPNPVAKGDWIVYGKYASGGEPLWFKQTEFVLVRAGDIVGKLRSGLTDLE